MTIREALAAHENDWLPHASRYRAAGLGELVSDPFASVAHRLGVAPPSLSVLVAAYNSAFSLPRVLVALEGSTFHRDHPDRLEVIVVDDGSEDGTWEAVCDLELTLSVRVLRQDRAGVAAAHNTALAHAQGDVVVFLDSDVVLAPHALTELAKRHAVLDGVTLLGFRFELDPADARLHPRRLRADLPALIPAFYEDFRLRLPGRPGNICRDTAHLRRLGGGRRVHTAIGAAYDLPAMVVGALFSLTRHDLLRIGGSDERFGGWGCEDTLVGAASIAIGNVVVPVYSAVGAHISHPYRTPDHDGEFTANLAIIEQAYDEPFPAGVFTGDDARARVREESTPGPAARGSRRNFRAPTGADVAPSPEALLRMRAKGMLALGRFAEAAECHARWERADPDSPWPRLGRAVALREAGDAAAALAVLETLAGRDHGAPEVAVERAHALAALGDYDAARSELARGRERGPDRFEPAWALGCTSDEHKRRGNAHAEQGLHAIAVTDFRLALMLDPGSPWAHFDLGRSLNACARFDDALGALARADALIAPDDGNRTWLHSLLAEVHRDRGDLAAAQAHVERALALDSGNEEARSLALPVDGAQAAGRRR